MTKADYLKVAAVLHEERLAIRQATRDAAALTTYSIAAERQARRTLARVEDALCTMFKQDNPRFDVQRFQLASGAYGEETPSA